MAQNLSDFVSTQPLDLLISRELKESSFRTLVITFISAMLGWYMLANIFNWLGDVVHVSQVVLIAGLASALAILLVRRTFWLARLVWLVGLCLSNLIALEVFHRPEFLYFYAMLPLLAAAITFRWQWGLVGEAALLALVILLAPAAGVPPPSGESMMVLLLGGMALLVGWAYSLSLLSIATWSMHNYRGARSELEALREERVRFVQTQEDFAQANKELSRMADRLAAMTLVAEEARRIKEEFVARVSHELRTPLNMVIGFSEVIMKSPQQYGESIPPALLADVDAILRNSQHLSRLVDDILDLSQVEAGRMALTKEWTCIPEIVDEAVSAVKGLFDSKGLYLRQEVDADLPPVFCDSTRIRQVIINLLGNASRFTESGGVVIRAALDNSLVTLSVSDTGAGISPKDQLRVFQPFQQVEESVLHRHKGGTGLGLTISKQFVEMHGGKMWLESQQGEGTTFFFALPVQPAQMELEDEAAEGARRWFNPYFQYDQRTRAANLPPVKANPRYLLVENEDSLQRLFTRYADNTEVVGLRRVEDAVSEAQRSPAKALILNAPVNLEEPGLQEKLGRLPFGTPVISCWLPGKEEAARQLGVVDYLIKPVSRQDVLAAMDKIAELKGRPLKRVLLVDDEPEILRLFVRMLSTADEPLQIVQAMNGRRALQLLRSRKPDVVLLDLIMPELNGFQVLQEKSQDPEIRDIPVIVVSSQNPRGEASMMSRTLSFTRGNGLSVHELLNCIQTVTNILVPEEQTGGRAPGETSPAKPVS